LPFVTVSGNRTRSGIWPAWKNGPT
jgi:hypothetical protein